MKKKLLLVALPALMVLSGCSNVNLEKAEKVENNEVLLREDTLAHEELFGGTNNLGVRKVGVPDTDPHSTSIPRIGVQFSGVYEDDVLDAGGNPTGERANYYAVRFVAAITGDLSTQNVVWTRGVSQVDSTEIRTMSSIGRDSTPLNSTAVYTSLNDNSVATGVPSGYDNFVVYTMYDIPVSEANSYIAAYVTVTPKAGGDSHQSCAVVTEIDGGHYFDVKMNDDLERNGYFLELYDSSTSQYWICPEDNELSTDTNPDDPLKDNALFSNLTLSTSDRFGIFRLTPTCFQFFGYDTFMGSSATAYMGEYDGVNQYGKASKNGEYSLFLNQYNLVYPIVTTTIYLDTGYDLGAGGKWGTDARFAAWAFGPSKSRWYDLTLEAGDIYKIEGYNVTDYPNLKFCRMNPGVDYNGWDKDNPLYNQTSNLDIQIPGDTNIITNNLYTVKAWDGSDNGTGNANWSNYGLA